MAYKTGRVREVAQDGSREFISLLACACADGSALPPALIYQGTSRDLQSTWVQDLKEGEEAYFASAANGWSSDAMGLAWLKRFDQHTAQKSSRHRLLIVDGHSSHVNMAFINAVDKLRIILLVFPPHTTHQLQPLDVALFSPLSNAYSTEMTRITHGGQGWVSMTKRSFWSVFKVAWDCSFTSKNIEKAFEATGIWPFNPSKRLKKLALATDCPSTPSSNLIRPSRTPANCRSVRRLVQSTPTAANRAIVARVANKLAAELEVQKHINGQLQAALFNEKDKRARGKRLGLTGEEVTGEACLWSPERIRKAQTHQATKAAAEEEEKRQKDQQKEEKDRARIQQLKKKEEGKAQKKVDKQLRDMQKAAEKEATEQRKQDRAIKKTAKDSADAQKKLDRIKRRNAVAAAVAEKAAERAKKASSKRPEKTAQNAPNPLQTTTTQLKSSTATATPENVPSIAHADAVIDLTGDPTPKRSRAGRAVHRPARFED